MYESFFGLSQKPFPAAPVANRYFAAGTIEQARNNATRCIQRAEGGVLVVGPAGTGKTLLCQVLAEQFRPQMAVALLSGGHLGTRRDLLQAILFELGQPYRGMEEGELRLNLIDLLTRSAECPHGMLLLVDEAHVLPLKLLEEIRMITNLARHGEPRVRLVLAGNPLLEEHFASPKLASFSQRLAARCYLEPFDYAETANYVRFLVAAAGGSPAEVFRPEALDAVYRATDGIPRLVNQLCDRALLRGYADQVRPLSSLLVEKAWADLQQLPTPWSAATAQAAANSAGQEVLEFGDLEDELPPPRPIGTNSSAPTEPGHVPRIQDEPLESEIAPVELGDALSAESAAPSADSVELPRVPAVDPPTPANELPQLVDPVSQTNDCLEQLDDQLHELELAFFGFGTSAPEVELDFDDLPLDDATLEAGDLEVIAGPLSEASGIDGQRNDHPRLEGPVVAPTPAFDSQTAAADLPVMDEVDDTSSLPLLNSPPPALPPVVERGPARRSERMRLSLEGEAVLHEDEGVEEVVIDRYAALDAKQGRSAKLSRNIVLPPAQTPATSPSAAVAPQVSAKAAPAPMAAAEKTLALTEALLRQASAIEETVSPGLSAYPDATSVVTTTKDAAEAPRETCSTIDLLPPGAELLLEVDGLPLHPAVREVPLGIAPNLLSFPANPVHNTTDEEELDLIVVEDDPQIMQVRVQPQVEPVRQQEYKNLFARLRRG